MNDLSIVIVSPKYLASFGQSLRAAYLLGVGRVYVDDRNKIYGGGNRKQLERFSAGAIHHVQVSLVEDPEEFLTKNADEHRQIATVVDSTATPLYDFRYGTNDLLVFGDEKGGLPEKVVEKCDELVTIPQISGGVQCHTLCSAVSIFLYEKKRQELCSSPDTA